MKTALLSCLFIGLSFAAHWCLWRIRIPRHQTRALLYTFVGVLIVGCLVFSSQLVRNTGWGLEWPWDYLRVVMFHVAMTLGYTVAYSAIENRSPSMTILAFVADAGKAGRSRGEVEALLCEDSPLSIRIDAMVRDGMVEKADGSLCLTAKGARWAAVFSGWATLLGVGKGA